MRLESVAAVIQFYTNIDVLLLIFIRIMGFTIIVPLFAGTNAPSQVKIGFSIFVALLIFLNGTVTGVSYVENVFAYGMLLAQEFFTGFIIGFVVYLIFSLIYYAGQLIDYQMGFSMLTVYDPLSQIQVPIVGNLFYMAICAIMIVTGGFNGLLRAFFNSFSLIPIGTAKIFGNGNLIWNMLQLLINFFVISVKISMPVVGTILVIDVVMGLLVKSVPQMNVFVVGAPIKLFVGMFVLVTTISVMNVMYSYTFNEAYNAVIDIIRRMAQ